MGCSRWPEGICQGFPKKYDLERSGNVEIFSGEPERASGLDTLPEGRFPSPKERNRHSGIEDNRWKIWRRKRYSRNSPEKKKGQPHV
ncbi:hypothetical protein HMPREF1555_00315 [Porphyromonas gingivalis F0570]|uniref:Uncharacterized protein n=1 Tax=Porphyromonas gingivalis F0570 TaxID=1227271 RepID=A0A0E2LST2_PORGN|nr:hypothetical protein HMPREF1555_00315 [Porphyromonas gingivalis F0570]